jgi:hypothetical protein
MKSYVTEGTGSQQTLTDSQNNKIPIYDSKADAEADLANLEEGQIVATKDTGDELAQPVDVVEEGNLHAVTSNAVAEYTGQLIKWAAISIGSYTVGAGQAISPKIENYAKPIPQGYSRFSLLYAVGQNYFTCSINFANNEMYATIRNNYTTPLTAEFMLYQIFIPNAGMIE